MVSEPIVKREISDYGNRSCDSLAKFEVYLHGIEAKPQHSEMYKKAKSAYQREHNETYRDEMADQFIGQQH